jgi:hypothetical protein
MELCFAYHDMGNDGNGIISSGEMESEKIYQVIGEGISLLLTERKMGKIEIYVKGQRQFQRYRISVAEVARPGREIVLKIIQVPLEC